MTTDTERIAALEARNAALDARMGGLESWLKSIDGNLKELTAVANMGKGALWMALKIGGFIAAIGAFVAWAAGVLHISIR